MCFYIHDKHREVKIADKDIICYKNLEFTIHEGKFILKSPFRNTIYKLDSNNQVKVYRFSKRITTFYNNEVIDKGLHSYSVLSKAKGEKKYTSFGVTIKCIIPKGTKYYYNPDCKEYVSLALQLKYLVK